MPVCHSCQEEPHHKGCSVLREEIERKRAAAAPQEDVVEVEHAVDTAVWAGGPGMTSEEQSALERAAALLLTKPLDEAIVEWSLSIGMAMANRPAEEGMKHLRETLRTAHERGLVEGTSMCTCGHPASCDR